MRRSTKVKTSVGGKKCSFGSKVEYRYAEYLEVLKRAGEIKDWWYEPKELKLTGKRWSYYIPDFIVENNDGTKEIHETKGYFPSEDATLLKRTSEQYAYPITLVFAHSPGTNQKAQAQIKRAKRLKREHVLKRIIWDANDALFKPISGLLRY